MKRVIVFTAIAALFSSFCFGQIQRKQAKAMDSATTASAAQNSHSGGMMRELNLDRQQKMKIKEAMQDMKAKKQSIDSDTTLTATVRQQKMKELRKIQIEKINSILTDQQREKLKQLRMDKKGAKKEEGNVTEITP